MVKPVYPLRRESTPTAHDQLLHRAGRRPVIPRGVATHRTEAPRSFQSRLSRRLLVRRRPAPPAGFASRQRRESAPARFPRLPGGFQNWPAPLGAWGSPPRSRNTSRDDQSACSFTIRRNARISCRRNCWLHASPSWQSLGELARTRQRSAKAGQRVSASRGGCPSIEAPRSSLRSYIRRRVTQSMERVAPRRRRP